MLCSQLRMETFDNNLSPSIDFDKSFGFDCETIVGIIHSERTLANACNSDSFREHLSNVDILAAGGMIFKLRICDWVSLHIQGFDSV